ncbi:molybdopterin biosynthesis MoeB protein [Nitzschia inconspicua]|uniref:Ubiquitin-like modifier-activating enzyme ATG7 n=1 Tax=Nitzschia inconspicua TaxID=303405 RepID=A0A9K3M173_9STRA|nr:molybdopterin biosynthesis MoeB protein [Nitzschia inconspicua]
MATPQITDSSLICSGTAIKFLPFSSTIDSPFWVQYCRLKLETIKLDESPIAIRASYGVENHTNASASGNSGIIATSNRMQFQESSLKNQGFQVPDNRVACQGILVGCNTLEAFQKVDKNALLKQEFCSQFFHETDEQKSIDVLSSFVALTFADLKQHKVLYWFGFPALLTQSPISATRLHLTAVLWQTLAQELQTFRQRENRLPPFFVMATGLSTQTTTSAKIFVPLSSSCLQELQADMTKLDDVVFGFLDPTSCSSSTSNEEVPIMGWPMRNLVAYLVLRLQLGGETVKIVSLRPGVNGGILKGRILPSADENDRIDMTPSDIDALSKHSVAMQVTLPTTKDYDFSKDGSSETPVYKVVGWELNSRQKPGPRWVNLRPLLDQNHLAIQAADLNLKLMKWRMIPSLNVEMLQSTKVLLLGAGTLGCSVARTLLGWGVRNFKFVDYGLVSYSNPVRQNLFTLDDCHFNHCQGRPKAQAAADALKTIAADVTSEGIHLSIPMPGHVAETTTSGRTDDGMTSLDKTVEQLDELVQEADAVFLLTDTRESRWLPTLVAAVHDKILINAALGLDSWLVMRHGGGDDISGNGTSTNRLGCYFCNDVVAPENSTKNRTLDQQCTVTRPGLAPIASSMAVELLVSLMHHSKRQKAPAPLPTSQHTGYSPAGSGSNDESSSALGVIPHQIRGSLVSYTMMTPTVPAFKCCTGCAAPVIEAYRDDKFGLVSSVCGSIDGSYLENLSGLTAFRAEAADKLALMEEDWEDDE